MSSTRLFSRTVFEATRHKTPNLQRLPKIVLGKKTKRGFFVFDQDKVPVMEAPDLTGFELRPYVNHAAKKIDKTKPFYLTREQQVEANKK